MLLRCFNATSGQAFVNGVDVGSASGEINTVFAQMGFCPQHNALFDVMTGREMLSFFCALRGVGADGLDRCVGGGGAGGGEGEGARRRRGRWGRRRN
jgi:ABC-type multidrug transport system ATPase subunit